MGIALSALAALWVQEQPTLKDFAWLAGSWEGSTGDAVFEEHWTTPAGGLMIGMGRLAKGDKTVFYEFLKLEESKDGIRYKVTVGEQPEVAFKLVRWKDKEAVFENREHDFPQRILYRREKDGSVTARIEGDRGGRLVGEDFKLKRRK
jgi:hypothetical protein